jgi:hypothetical protein
MCLFIQRLTILAYAAAWPFSGKRLTGQPDVSEKLGVIHKKSPPKFSGDCITGESQFIE